MPRTNANADAYLKLILANSVVTADTPTGPNVYDEFGGTGANSTIGKTVTAGSLYVSLHTASPGATGTQSTSELSYTGSPNYTRQGLTRGAGSIWTFSTPADGFGAQAVNFADILFSKMTGGTGGTVLFWGLGLNQTGAGTLLWYGPLGLETAKPFTCDATDVTNNDITCPDHGYVGGDLVAFTDVPGDQLPGALDEVTYYFVTTANLGTHTFRVSTISAAGAQVDISSTGSGYVTKVLSKTIGINDEPKIAAGAMVIIER